jgi:hypothetical protein
MESHHQQQKETVSREIWQHPKLYRFFNTQRQVSSISSGVTSARIQLSAVNGPVSHLIFFLRPQGAVRNHLIDDFTPVCSFALTSSSGENIVGKQVVPTTENQLVMMKEWFQGTGYLCNNSPDSKNQMKRIYAYSFAQSPEMGFGLGHDTGFYPFSSTESLELNFPSQLEINVELYIIYYSVSYLQFFKGDLTRRD